MIRLTHPLGFVAAFDPASLALIVSPEAHAIMFADQPELQRFLAAVNDAGQNHQLAACVAEAA